MIVNMSSVVRPCPRVVKWFYESGEPMPGIVENAAQNEGSLELIQCVVKRCPSKNTPKAVRIATQHKNVVVMRWLLEQFSQLDADLVSDLVVEFGYTEVLAIQTESNRLSAIASAAREGKLDVVKQLFKGDRERFAGTQRVIGEAVQGGKMNVVQWLRQHVDYEDRYTWAFRPATGRTRARDEDMPQGLQMLLAFGNRGQFM
ncbi:hypothetical protein PF002_g11830 [Phytophthora fragariae]|uniref:Uncharacterized protein n=1 Tax=Phytophthora fragariae TaxID=53985 RepID=A0A6A3ZCM0_9STRA|nr:hypothetical protein PF003_g39559 [Phytophthora fragariae]KAE9234357.1 hypothetical protein PF002_g11830 [Phytophthora fragariae]